MYEVIKLLKFASTESPRGAGEFGGERPAMPVASAQRVTNQRAYFAMMDKIEA